MGKPHGLRPVAPCPTCANWRQVAVGLTAPIEDKKKGHKPAKVAEPNDTNVVDLMSALRASLSAKDKAGAGADKAKPAKPPAKAKARKAS